MVEANRTLEEALRLHQAGRLREAETLYAKVLSTHPDHPDALHLMGVLQFHANQPAKAEQLIRKAMSLAPASADYYCNYGMCLAKLQRTDEAIAAWQAALRLRPAFPEVLNNLAIAFQSRGQSADAIEACTRALQYRPAFPDAHFNLGVSLRSSGRIEQAIASFQNALALRPDFIEAMNHLGDALHGAGRFDDAVQIYRRALSINPDLSLLWCNLGNALRETGQYDAAIDAYRKSISLTPDQPESHANLADVLRAAGQLDLAEEAIQRALRLRPRFPEAFTTLGNIRHAQRRIDEAIGAHRSAIELSPNHAPAHFNLAHCLLLSGQFAEGWKEFEWRWQAAGPLVGRRQLGRPEWDGAPLNGRRILLHAEQGFGDSIQFVRYLPHIAALGGKALLVCQLELLELFKLMPGIDQLIPEGQSLPQFDVHAPLMSLARVLGTSKETVPCEVPYLHANPETVNRFREMLPPGRKVGIAWAGRPAHTNDRNRSIPLSLLSPLLQAGGVTFVSLQKNPPRNSSHWQPPASLLDLTSDLNSFADTAALIDSLDLVISVDTAVAHLAGAMGKPVWVLLPFVPDWRWMLDREDSPWYPTMTLFRQSTRGDWRQPIERIRARLDARQI
jgi:tetratricopeptide (TPR) repeat protein